MPTPPPFAPIRGGILITRTGGLTYWDSDPLVIADSSTDWDTATRRVQGTSDPGVRKGSPLAGYPSMYCMDVQPGGRVGPVGSWEYTYKGLLGGGNKLQVSVGGGANEIMGYLRRPGWDKIVSIGETVSFPNHGPAQRCRYLEPQVSVTYTSCETSAPPTGSIGLQCFVSEVQPPANPWERVPEGLRLYSRPFRWVWQTITGTQLAGTGLWQHVKTATFYQDYTGVGGD